MKLTDLYERADPGLDLAARLLKVELTKLKPVSDPEVEDEVLENGRAIKKEHFKMVHGTLVVVLYKVDNQLYARIEYPDGEKKLYTA